MRLAFLLLACLFAAAPAAAQQITAGDPQSVVTYLRVKKATAQLEKAGNGNPYVAAKLDDRVFIVTFIGCTQGAQCRAVSFRWAINLTEAKATADAAKINLWNASHDFTKAFLGSDNRAFLVSDVILGDKGLELGDFDRVFSVYLASMKQFDEFIRK